MRKYGEGLIIADQIPNKLTPEVLKNTNTKIIHRLFAADDRHAIGDTIGLDDEQKEFLTSLAAGEAIVFSAGWHQAVRVQVNTPNDTNAPEIDSDIIKVRSQERIFQQRHKLYPNLSVCEDWDARGAKVFNEYVVDATQMLNLVIRWVMSPSQAWVDRITHANTVMKNKYPMINTKQTLLELFKDIAPVSLEMTYTNDLKVDDLLKILIDLISSDQLPADAKGGDDERFKINATVEGRHLWADISKVFKQMKSI